MARAKTFQAQKPSVEFIYATDPTPAVGIKRTDFDGETLTVDFFSVDDAEEMIEALQSAIDAAKEES